MKLDATATECLRGGTTGTSGKRHTDLRCVQRTDLSLGVGASFQWQPANGVGPEQYAAFITQGQLWESQRADVCRSNDITRGSDVRRQGPGN